MRIGPIGRLLAPGYGQCGRCRTPWKFAPWHHTSYSEPTLASCGWGCIALCEKCWAGLTPEQRLPHYERLVQRGYEGQPLLHNMTAREEWALVKSAVLAGG